MRAAHAATEPVGERVHVAVLDDGLVDDQRQHGRRRLELRNVRRVRADLACDLQQAVDRLLDAADGHDEQRPAGSRRPRPRRAPMPRAITQ